MPRRESETIVNATPKIYNATGYMSPIATVKNGQRYTSTGNGDILEPTYTLVTPTTQQLPESPTPATNHQLFEALNHQQAVIP